MNMYKFQRQRKSNGQYQGTALGDETKNQISNQKEVIKQNKKAISVRWQRKIYN